MQIIINSTVIFRFSSVQEHTCQSVNQVVILQLLTSASCFLFTRSLLPPLTLSLSLSTPVNACVCVFVCAVVRQPSQLEGYLGTCVLHDSPRATTLGRSHDAPQPSPPYYSWAHVLAFRRWRHRNFALKTHGRQRAAWARRLASDDAVCHDKNIHTMYKTNKHFGLLLCH